MKSLVVDDELASRNKLEKILSGFGECEALARGHEAVDAFKEALESGTPFELITLDISMPEMSGTEVLSAIREIEKEKNIPEEKQAKIIMITASSDKEVVVNSIKMGCNDYLVKPFPREAVIAKVEKYKA